MHDEDVGADGQRRQYTPSPNAILKPEACWRRVAEIARLELGIPELIIEPAVQRLPVIVKDPSAKLPNLSRQAQLDRKSHV